MKPQENWITRSHNSHKQYIYITAVILTTSLNIRCRYGSSQKERFLEKWIEFPWLENRANTHTQHMETLDSRFDPTRSHLQCTPWPQPPETEPATTDCRAETPQLSHQCFRMSCVSVRPIFWSWKLNSQHNSSTKKKCSFKKVFVRDKNI